MATPTASFPDLIEITDAGELRLNFHPGQWKAWESRKRIVCVLAGSQGGKTSFGPPWLWREIKAKGPGDYLVVTPTYKLLQLKALPEFRRFFEQYLSLGEYIGSPTQKFTFSPDGALRTFGSIPDTPTHVYFGHAQDPDSLESATAKAAWLDEAGQKKFKLGSIEAVNRRLAIHQGRILITTTPYDLGWLKQHIWDPWKAAGENHPLIDVIRFDSTENPAFPPAEFERARAELPLWKFNLFYKALFTRPAGLIYDAFDETMHKVPRFTIPRDWRRFLGLDFGGVNTAGVFFAEEPGTKKLYAYREYKAGGRTAAEHAKALLATEPGIPQCVGGSKSEGQWRDEFRAGGLPVREPEISDVEVGIDRVYGCMKRGELFVFNDLAGFLEDILTYSRELDDAGNPTEKIEDQNQFHHADAARYILGWLRPNRIPVVIGLPRDSSNEMDRLPRGIFGTGGPSPW